MHVLNKIWSFFLLILVLCLFTACESSSFDNEYLEKRVLLPENALSVDEKNIFYFNYLTKDRQNFLGFLDKLSSLREDEGFFYVDFVDQIDSFLFSGSFEKYLFEILKHDFELILSFDEAFDFSSNFLFSFATLNKKMIYEFLDLYFTSNHKNVYRKFEREGFLFWFVESENIFIGNGQNVFLFSNDLKKFDNALFNLKNSLSDTDFSFTKNSTNFSFFSFEFGIDFLDNLDFLFIFEDKGLRFFAEEKNFIEERQEQDNLIRFFPNENLVFFVENKALKQFFKKTFQDVVQGFLTLDSEEIHELFSKNFAFSISYESFFPEMIFYFDFQKESKKLGEKVVKGLDRFFDDLFGFLALELLDLGQESFKGFVKKEKFSNDIRKITFDFSLIPVDKKIELSWIFGEYNEDIVFEFYYGLSVDGIFVMAFYKDFFDVFKKQGVLNGDLFLNAKENVHMKQGQAIFIFDFAQLNLLLDDVFSLLNRLSIVDYGIQDVYLGVLSEVFSDFVLFEDGLNNGVYEGFFRFYE